MLMRNHTSPAPDRHPAENNASKRPQRRFSAAKLALTSIAGVAIAVFLVQRPLTAPLPATVEMSEMTWIEIRSAMTRGYTTVIVPTGGIEQNGPHMITGKHDYIVRWTANRIASELGHTLVTSVVSFVPEGDYDPPNGHMRYPGTLGVPEAVFAQVLEGIARSLKATGFKTICFIGDHGGNQKPQAEVAEKLSREWAGKSVRVIHAGDYYAEEAQNKFLRDQGETPAAIGEHASIVDTSELLAVYPAGVDIARFAERPFSLESTGVSGDPAHASVERGKALLAIKVDAAVRQIRAALPTN
jgi:creatinine amidohydrolase/Fe(II)-dependent formamide hydrolase-like protein